MSLEQVGLGRNRRGPGEGSRRHLVVVGANFVTAPLEVREVLARRATYGRLRRIAGTRPPWDDLLLLRTCNRIEVYIVSRSHKEAAEAIRRGLALGKDSGHLYVLEDEAAAEHVLRVATGLDSVSQGEDQVMAQLRKAARDPDVNGGFLPTFFAQVLRSALRVRAAAGIANGHMSAAMTAFRFIEDAVPVETPDVVLLGTGKMARLAAEALKRRASITFLGRDSGRAKRAGSAVDGRSDGLRGLRAHLARADVVISATSQRRPLLNLSVVQPAIARRSGRRLWLIDLGFPRNIDPRCGSLDGVTLVDIDGLAPWGWHPLSPVALARAELRIREETERLVQLLVPAAEDDIARFRQAAETVRKDEVERALGRLSRLSPEERFVIDKLATRLVNRFLHSPTEWLRRLPQDVRTVTRESFVRRLEPGGEG